MRYNEQERRLHKFHSILGYYCSHNLFFCQKNLADHTGYPSHWEVDTWNLSEFECPYCLLLLIFCFLLFFSVKSSNPWWPGCFGTGGERYQLDLSSGGIPRCTRRGCLVQKRYKSWQLTRSWRHFSCHRGYWTIKPSIFFLPTEHTIYTFFSCTVFGGKGFSICNPNAKFQMPNSWQNSTFSKFFESK